MTLMNTNCIVTIATIVNAIAAISIAYLAYRANQLNKSIHQENNDKSIQIEKLYWGMIVSNILNIDDSAIRKRKLNILFTLFKVDEIVEKSQIPAQSFLNILHDIDGNDASNALNQYLRNKNTKP